MTLVDEVYAEITVPRETDELIPVVVKRDGVVITAGLEFCIVAGSTRPSTWTGTIEASGKPCIQVQSLTPGKYRVYVRIPTASESPVIDAGRLIVS